MWQTEGKRNTRLRKQIQGVRSVSKIAGGSRASIHRLPSLDSFAVRLTILGFDG
jgi:hypothetical protein